MAFFGNLKTSLKQKWLQFFQENRSWLTLQMEVESVYTPDGGRRPPSYLILGVVNALEPELAELMLPFFKLNQDADALIDVLELNFDPDLFRGNRLNLQVISDELGDIALVNEMADEVVLVESDEGPILVVSASETDAFGGDVSLDEIADAIAQAESDNESLETPTTAQPDEVSDVLSEDVWGEENNSESAKADKEQLLGDEKQSEEEKEISRLFPNL